MKKHSLTVYAFLHWQTCWQKILYYGVPPLGDIHTFAIHHAVTLGNTNIWNILNKLNPVKNLSYQRYVIRRISISKIFWMIILTHSIRYNGVERTAPWFSGFSQHTYIYIYSLMIIVELQTREGRCIYYRLHPAAFCIMQKGINKQQTEEVEIKSKT